MGGGSSKQKSTVSVTTPPPTAEETQARKEANQINELQMKELGYQRSPGTPSNSPEAQAAYLAANPDVAAQKDWAKDPYGHFQQYGQAEGRQWPILTPGEWVKAPLTPEQEQQAARDKQINDMIYAKLTGEVSPQDKANIEQAYGSARQVGVSDLNQNFSDAMRQIQQSSTNAAAGRGLNVGDSPITGQVAENQRLLGGEFSRNLRNFETSLSGAQAGSMLDVGQRQQLFGQALREFQAGLSQQAMQNRQAIGESFANTALGLGNLRSRNITQTTTGTGSSGSSASGIMGGAGGLMQGIGSMGSMFGSMFGSSSRNFKDNIEDVNLDEILAQLEQMGVYEWNYKPLFNDARRHIGPVIEESPASIVDGTTLVFSDCIGFLFATVKALNEKVKRLEGR